MKMDTNPTATIHLNHKDYILNTYNMVVIPTWIRELDKSTKLYIEIELNSISQTLYSIPLIKALEVGRHLSLESNPFAIPRQSLTFEKVMTSEDNKQIIDYY
jgi:hypothetical protein